jgi:methionine sulfoxide reductase heme-binding subunit
LNFINAKAQLGRERWRLRILKHHLPLFGFSIFSIVALYATRPYKDLLSRASFATAYPALILLAATLIVGPCNLLGKRRNPLSSDLRRDIGIWAGILGVLHTAVGQNVHLRGRPWLYYVYALKEHHAFPLRHDLFGLANYTGAVSVVVLMALLATSNDFSLRRLGASGWKKLQRWNYAVFALAAVHAVAYQAIEKQKLLFVATVILCIAITLALQISGFIKRHSADGSHARQQPLDTDD